MASYPGRGYWLSARINEDSAPIKTVPAGWENVQAWEKFVLEPVRVHQNLGSGIYTIQSAENGKYIAPAYANKHLVAAYDSHDQFELTNHGDGRMTFRSVETGQNVVESGGGLYGMGRVNI